MLEDLRASGREISQVLFETCFLAEELIKWNNETDKGKTEGLDLTKIAIKTNDPAPPFNYETNPEAYGSVEKLEEMLLDPK